MCFFGAWLHFGYDSKMLEAHVQPTDIPKSKGTSRNYRNFWCWKVLKKKIVLVCTTHYWEQILSFPAQKSIRRRWRWGILLPNWKSPLDRKFASRLMTGPTTICFFDLYRLKFKIKPNLLVVVFLHILETGMAIEPGSFEDIFSIAKEVPIAMLVYQSLGTSNNVLASLEIPAARDACAS